MCDGWVDPLGRVVCPLHKYRFDPANGRNTSGEGYKMVTYPVEVRNEEIFIGMLPASPKVEDIAKDNGLSFDDDIERW